MPAPRSPPEPQTSRSGAPSSAESTPLPTVSRSSRWVRSPRRPWASSHFCPARPVSASVRSDSVASKSGAAPNRPAARRRIRRCSAGGSSASRATSMARPSPAARPPPRTGRPGKIDLRRQPLQLGLPPRLLVPRQLRHLRQVRPQPRIPALQQRQQFVPDPVARKRQMPVRRVLAPPLPQRLQISLDLVSCSPRAMAAESVPRETAPPDECRRAPPSTPRAETWPAPSPPGRPACAPWPPHPQPPKPSVPETSHSAGAALPPRSSPPPFPPPASAKAAAAVSTCAS